MALNLPFGSRLIPLITLLFISLTLLLLIKPNQNSIHHFKNVTQSPEWYNVLMKETQGRKIKVGLLNINEGADEIDQLHGLVEVVTVRFDHVNKDHQWLDFFPEWMDEDEIEGPPSCPEIPMPEFEDYHGLDVVVVQVPCKRGADREGIRDVFRLQLNLVAANLLVRSAGWKNHSNYQWDRTVYAVFIGSCGPMREIFRCDDLLVHEEEFLVYKPHLRKLTQKVLMPVGTCQVAPPHEEPGEEMGRRAEHSIANNTDLLKPREAYVTALHSSDTYVCGAIALAQSLIQTNTTKDLILLADDYITTRSLQGLRAAGWKIKHIERIRSPHAKRKIYSEWNYSKLRIWQLTEYDKIIYIDADLIVLDNIDKFFVYPQLSAVADIDSVFNSGVMLVEPSQCTFETLMEKMFKVASYDDADQGFLNEMFTWWHRWPSRINRLKIFDRAVDKKHEIPGNSSVIHYMGLKPWICLADDYDCNWDIPGLHRFASDSAHRRWLQVYEAMPKKLQWYCELTIQEDPHVERIKKWRESYKDGTFFQGTWKIYLLITLFIFFSLLVLQREKVISTIAHVLSLARPYFDKKSN